MASQEKYRFHCENLSVGAGAVELSMSESHHAMHVLRLTVGAEVELFDGLGRKVAGRIAQARHGIVRVELIGAAVVQPRPRPEIHLAFATPKGKRLDWLLEKATELGAASLTAVRFERSVAGAESLSENARERWMGHCIAAAKQCGLDFLPEIHEPVAVEEFVSNPATGMLRLVGDLGEDALSLPRALSGWQPGQPVAVLVGPEGGLTQAERDAIIAGGFAPVRLGGTTLRIETAAVALLAGVLAQR
jgi:16S rRNA (uracil1498-N3)-methyltransferase